MYQVDKKVAVWLGTIKKEKTRVLLEDYKLRMDQPTLTSKCSLQVSKDSMAYNEKSLVLTMDDHTQNFVLQNQRSFQLRLDTITPSAVAKLVTTTRDAAQMNPIACCGTVPTGQPINHGCLFSVSIYEIVHIGCLLSDYPWVVDTW